MKCSTCDGTGQVPDPQPQPPEVPLVHYYGCIEEAGHYFWKSLSSFVGRPGRAYDDADRIKAYLRSEGRKENIDGGFAPQHAPQVEGIAKLHHISKLTILAFWDRSVDSRGGSSSTFIIERGGLTFGQAMDFARAAWPKVWERYKFAVTQAQDAIS